MLNKKKINWAQTHDPWFVWQQSTIDTNVNLIFSRNTKCFSYHIILLMWYAVHLPVHRMLVLSNGVSLVKQEIDRKKLLTYRNGYVHLTLWSHTYKVMQPLKWLASVASVPKTKTMLKNLRGPLQEKHTALRGHQWTFAVIGVVMWISTSWSEFTIHTR